MSWLSSSANSGGEDLQVNCRNRLLEKHQPSTGEWLKLRQEYIDWVNLVAAENTGGKDNNSLLWLRGKREYCTTVHHSCHTDGL
jgi:hypothetical protein